MISPGSVRERERAAAAKATVAEKDKQLGMWQAFAAETANAQKSAIAHHQQQAQRQYESTEAAR